jgi:hypothetical protein
LGNYNKNNAKLHKFHYIEFVAAFLHHLCLMHVLSSATTIFITNS